MCNVLKLNRECEQSSLFMCPDGEICKPQAGHKSFVGVVYPVLLRRFVAKVCFKGAARISVLTMHNAQ